MFIAQNSDTSSRIVSPPFLGLRVSSCQPKSYAVWSRTTISQMITADSTAVASQRAHWHIREVLPSPSQHSGSGKRLASTLYQATCK